MVSVLRKVNSMTSLKVKKKKSRQDSSPLIKTGAHALCKTKRAYGVPLFVLFPNPFQSYLTYTRIKMSDAPMLHGRTP